MFLFLFKFPFSLHCSLSPITVILTETKHWSINVPSSVKGLTGSCVVIPCSFDFPDSENDLLFTGMWQDNSDQPIYHSVESKIMRTYWNRTKLLGNLAQKNCSLKIDPLNDSDRGPFHFRIEIHNLNKYSYKHNKVSILMISKSSNTMLISGPEGALNNHWFSGCRRWTGPNFFVCQRTGEEGSAHLGGVFRHPFLPHVSSCLHLESPRITKCSAHPAWRRPLECKIYPEVQGH